MSIRTIMVFSLAFGLIISLGCKKKKNQAPPEERGQFMGDAGVDGPADKRYGSQGQVTVQRVTTGGIDPANEAQELGAGETIERTYKNCKDLKPITKADRATPEGTLWLVFKALQMPDAEAGFEAFSELVDLDYSNERTVRRWFDTSRIEKKGIRPFLRLVYTDKDPSYDICSTQKNGEVVKIFVGKSPPVGSNPPYGLHKVDDKWLIKTYTPF